MRAAVAGTLAWLAMVAAPATASAVVVSKWRMNEKSGTTMVDSVGANNGTLQNVTIGVPGWKGVAYQFDGATSLVTVPSSDSLNPGAANIRFTVHIDYTVTPPNSSTTDYDVLRKGTASNSAQFYKLEIRPDNRAVCRFVGSNTTSAGLLIHDGPTLNDGLWHTITCIKTATRIKMVIDGVVFALKGVVGSVSNTGDLTLGAKPGSPFTDFYNGTLDDVSISIG